MLTIHIGRGDTGDAPTTQEFADVPTCLLVAARAALPVFLDSLVKCLTSAADTADRYNPGTRTRC